MCVSRVVSPSAALEPWLEYRSADSVASGDSMVIPFPVGTPVFVPRASAISMTSQYQMAEKIDSSTTMESVFHD